MKKIGAILMLFFMLINTSAQSDFLNNQKRYQRVRTAISEKESKILSALKKSNIEIGALNILIMAYKAEGELEIFAKSKTEASYRKIATYKVCSKSGDLGPKRKQGDYQVPEGFYYIDRFNPASNFFLSLGINYPNQSDRIKSKARHLGGDIFIHGDCVTIGCLPMTDDKIKEIYLYAINARNNGQKRIPVYIFPFRMADQNFKAFSEKHINNPDLLDFWTNIRSGYTQFEKDKKELKFTFSETGEYSF